VKSRAE
jgi:HSP20 family protein